MSEGWRHKSLYHLRTLIDGQLVPVRGARTWIQAHNSGTCLRVHVPSQKMILSAWPIIPIILLVRSCYTLYMRHVCKIRSPRHWRCEECFTWDLPTLECSLAPPPSNPHKTGPAVMLSLDCTAMHDGASARFSCQVRVACSDPFFECQGHNPHWHSSSGMWSLWATVYGCQKCVKVGQTVHVWTYRRSWWTVFWSA